MVDRERITLKLKVNEMDQCPARRQQWRLAIGGSEEIALAGKNEGLDAVAGVQLQHVAADDAARRSPLGNRQRAGGDVGGGAEMGADTAPFGPKMLQLTLRPEADQAAGDRARRGSRLPQVAALQRQPGD